MKAIVLMFYFYKFRYKLGHTQNSVDMQSINLRVNYIFTIFAI